MSGTLRVTGGRLAGRTVKVPPGVIRPAMDRMRESLFAVLGPLDGLTFLDLFAGSAIMAVEAISRGAEEATLVERDRGKFAVLQKNLELVGDQTRLIISPVERFIARCRETFGVVYLDPPFNYRFKADLLERIGKRGLVSPGGRLLIHYPHPEQLPGSMADLTCSDEREYGRSHVRFYTRS